MRSVVGVFSLLVLFLLASPLAAPRADDPGGPGPYAVGHTSFLVFDSTRNTDSPFAARPVPVNVWYPSDASAIDAGTPDAVYPLGALYAARPLSTSSDWEQFGMPKAYEGTPVAAGKPFPLVVVSPGWTNAYYELLFYAQRIASHGFVVAVTQHYRDGVFGDEPFDPLPVALINRPRDVSFMLDAVLARNADPGSILFGSVRADLVAASGHSLGGYAAFALTAGDDEVCGAGSQLATPCNSLGATSPDPRISAIATLDGSAQLLHFSELARIAVPSILIGRAADKAGTFLARPHAAISGHPHYRVDVQNSLHPSFTNNCITPRVLYAKGLISAIQRDRALAAPTCTTALSQAEVNRLAAKYAIAFLETQLAGDQGYQDILTPGWALTVEHDIGFFTTEPANATPLGEDPCCFRYFTRQPGSETERAERDPSVPILLEDMRYWN